MGCKDGRTIVRLPGVERGPLRNVTRVAGKKAKKAEQEINSLVIKYMSEKYKERNKRNDQTKQKEDIRNS